uniref:Uncharacterized protein n=1 Tax=Arundo donax TaxID=35708 RepID=A0A0A9FFZ9_ARUDO
MMTTLFVCRIFAQSHCLETKREYLICHRKTL